MYNKHLPLIGTVGNTTPSRGLTIPFVNIPQCADCFGQRPPAPKYQEYDNDPNFISQQLSAEAIAIVQEAGYAPSADEC